MVSYELRLGPLKMCRFCKDNTRILMPLVVEYTFFPLHLKPVQTQKKCSAASSTLVVTNLLSNYRQRLYTKYHISWLPCVPDSNWCRPLVGMPGRSHPPLPLPATCIMNIPCTLNFRHTVHGLCVVCVCFWKSISHPGRSLFEAQDLELVPVGRSVGRLVRLLCGRLICLTIC